MRIDFRSATVVTVVVSLTMSGCVGFAGRHYERIPRKERLQPPVVAPVIVVSLTGSTPAEEGMLVDAYQEVKEKHEFLSNARFGVSNSSSEEPADFTLEIHADVTEKEWGSAELSGYTFALFPYYWSQKIEFRATLWDSDGVELSSHTGSRNVRILTQLFLIWVAPLNLFMIPYIHGRRKVVHGLLNLVERDIRHAMQEQEGSE